MISLTSLNCTRWIGAVDLQRRTGREIHPLIDTNQRNRKSTGGRFQNRLKKVARRSASGEDGMSKISFVRTLNAFALVIAVSSLVVIKEAEARSIKDRIIEGSIAGYECGDNCYLKIIDNNQKEHTGLCTARECQPWNDQSEMPSRFIGKRVVVTVGTGAQIDASGKVRGKMDAFNAIHFLRLEGR